MPGSVSDFYSPPICKCGRFKGVHDWPSGTITAEEGIESCDGYKEVPLEETEFGKSIDAFLDQFS